MCAGRRCRPVLLRVRKEVQVAVKRRKNRPDEADELLREYGDLRAEGLYGQLAAASSRRFWWYTGELEVAAGLWLIAVGLIFAAYPVDGISSVAGWILLLVSLSIPIVVPMLLRDVLVLSRGLCLSAPPRPAANRVLSAATLVAYAAVCAAAFLRVSSTTPVLVVCTVLGVLCLLVYMRWGCMRHYLVSALVVAGGPFAYQLGLAMRTAGMLGHREALIVGALGQVSISALAVATIVFGALVLVGGLRALVRSVSVRARTVAESDEPQRLIANLSSSDAEMRFLTVVYLNKHPQPTAVVQLVRATSDSSVAIAQTAKSALCKVWGPSADERYAARVNRTALRSKQPVEYTYDEWKFLKGVRAEAQSGAREQRDAVRRELVRQAPLDRSLHAQLAKLCASSQQNRSLAACSARMLASLGDPYASAMAGVLLYRSDGDRAMARSLCEGFAGADGAVAPFLARLLVDKRAWMRRCVADAACQLMAELEQGDAAARNQALDVFEAPTFELLASESSVNRVLGLRMGVAYGERAADTMDRMCSDKSAAVRSQALLGLARTAPLRAERQVFSALADKRAVVRLAALQCIDELQLARALPQVEPLVNDASDEVKALANELLLVSRDW